jgi:hypothetical protein
MDRCVGAAALLAESDRRDLAIEALARSATISDLSARHGVSRKFSYQQTDKARTALDDAFLSAAPDDEVLFEVAVTKTWRRQVIVGLTLICRGSYRGVVEFLRDLLGVSISVGTFTKCLNGPHSRRASSTTTRICQAFAWACTMNSSRAQCPCWPASMPHRLIAISWLRRNIAMPIRGVCIFSTPPGRD